jgi:low affinity Fe/Cu permease
MKRAFADIATTIDQLSERPLTFVVALLIIAAWALSGPLFNFSDTWQLIINTSTTIITFLMVFVIQNTQNRDGAAIQAKLDELIRVSAARNTLIGIETLTQDEIEEIRATCAAKARRASNGAQREVNKNVKTAVNKAMSKPRGQTATTGLSLSQRLILETRLGFHPNLFACPRGRGMLLTKYFLAGNLILGKRYCLWQSRGIFISLERRLLVHVGFAIPRVRENVFMDRIEPYLSHAADCQQMAWITRNEHERLIWLDMAQSWLQLAQACSTPSQSPFDNSRRDAA